MMKNNVFYSQPDVDVLEVVIEKGFASSLEDPESGGDV